MSRLPVTLKYIERYARFFKNKRLKELGLSNRQAEIILNLLHHPGSSQDDIADRLLINKSGITRQLTVMEEDGLVKRTVSPTDRRVTLVSLTQKAEALVPGIREINRQWADFMTEGLSEEEQELLGKVLESIRDRIQAKLEQEG